MNPYRRPLWRGEPTSGDEPPRFDGAIALAGVFIFVLCAVRAWLGIHVDGELKGESGLAFLVAWVSGYYLLLAAHRLLAIRVKDWPRLRAKRTPDKPDPPPFD